MAERPMTEAKASKAPKKVHLRNYLWVSKKIEPRLPAKWAPLWEHRFALNDTPQGRLHLRQLEQAAAALGEPAPVSGEDQGTVLRSWSETTGHWALNRGDLNKVNALVKSRGWKVIDERVEVPWGPELDKLRLVMEPRPHQVEPLEQWVEAGHGILEADPAFGKTFMLISLLLRLRQKALILVPTDVLANQFITRFREGSGSAEEGYTPITNCIEVEAKGLTIVGRYRGGSAKRDETFPVTVATWQSLQGGRADHLTKEFGLVLLDEAHGFAAPVAASAVHSFWAKYRYGVTATTERKDGQHVALIDVVGPITARGYAKQVPVTAAMITTGVKYFPSRYSRKSEWSALTKALYKSTTRNDLIYDWVRYDIEQGRRILLLSGLRGWCLDTVEFLRREFDIEAKAIVGGDNSPSGIRRRNSIIAQMTSGSLQVICATSIFKEGVDIPVLDCVYAISPMNNAGLLKQMLGRARRVHGTKERAYFRYFCDDGFAGLLGCARGTIRHLRDMGVEVIAVPLGAKPSDVQQSIERAAAREIRGLRRVAREEASMATLLRDEIPTSGWL